jgi:hypothetical protein
MEFNTQVLPVLFWAQDIIRMASKRRGYLMMMTAQELIFDSDSDTHISEDEISSHESDSEKEEA